MMISLSLVLFATTLFAGSFAAPAEKRSALTDKITALQQANTANDRYKILGQDGLAFSFLDADSFAGGGLGSFIQMMVQEELVFIILFYRRWRCPC
jgi:hypothetical protein